MDREEVLLSDVHSHSITLSNVMVMVMVMRYNDSAAKQCIITAAVPYFASDHIAKETAITNADER